MGSALEIDLPAIEVEWVALGGLRAFLKVAWPQIDPAPLVHSWHMDEIADHLEAVYSGDIKNLLINVPPATGKSSLVVVLGPLWAWIKDPTIKWIFGSNDPKLANRDALRVREILASKWWKDRWPHVRLNPRGSEAVGDYQTDKMGQRLSVGIGTRLIGRHADIKVIDDPNKPLGLDGPVDVSQADLDRTIDWYTGTLAGRNVDVKTLRTIIVMQRLHERDLTGYLLDQMRKGGTHFEHLCLPMEFEPESKCKTKVGGDRRTKAGELLAPARTDAEGLKILKKLYVTERKISAQLQQRPSPRSGGIIKAHWLRHWGPCSPDCKGRQCQGSLWEKQPPIEQMRVSSSWDLTFDGQDHNDFVVGQEWGHWNGFAILLDQKRDQWTFLETLRIFQDCHETHWPKAFIKRVENKANAPALENVLRKKVPGIKLINPEGSKGARLEACEELFEGGFVVYPSPLLHPWVEEINFHELLSFPSGANDDTVDATSQELKPLTMGNKGKRLDDANKGGREFLSQQGVL